MKRYLPRIAAVLLLVVAALGGWIYHRVTTLTSEQVTKDVWMISGFGGNVGVLRTDAGTVIIDTMTFKLQGDRIAALADKLTGNPVVLVINTHYHMDHTHGNPAFGGKARVVSTSRTLTHLLNLDARYWQGDTAASLPTETFEQDHVIPIGGKTIRLLHPGRGHTDGDLVALFVEDRVLHTGDLLFNGFYPNVDLEAGGSLREWPQSLDRAAEYDFDKVIPGHGAVADREAIARFRAFLVDLWTQANDAARRGWTLDQTLTSVHLTADTGMQVLAFPFVLRLDRDFDVRRAWEEATGAVKVYDATPPQGGDEKPS
jgi:cyclase